MSTCRSEILSAIGSLQTRNGGKPVSPIEIIREMNRVGTTYSDSTIGTHVVSAMCVNAPDNHAKTWPDLRRVGRGQYVLNEEATVAPTPARDGSKFIHHDPRAWPWEGAVQEVFATYLREHGWSITGMADTATKAHGVDLLALKGDRLLGAEVKGWPSKGYADLRRAHEVKKTQPTNQAVHWFSQALMTALMLLDSHPDHESLVVLPDYPRYRDLTARTVTGRTAAGVHVVFVQPVGSAESDSWAA